MLAFARAAKKIVLHSDSEAGNTRVEEWEWQEQRVESIPGAGIGDISERPFLRIQGGGVSVLFALDRDGFASVSAKLPTLWVTAPTDEYAELGFLLNGPFDLDVGRAQLARTSEENQELARKAARELAHAFRSLASCDLTALQAELGIHVASPALFWSSFFDVLTRGFLAGTIQLGVVGLARQVLWEENGPAHQLYRDFPVLPTGLAGEHEGLTSLDTIRWHTDGALEDPEVFGQVINLPLLGEQVRPGMVVSKMIWQRLQAVAARPKSQPLNLTSVIRTALGEQVRVTPGVANQLGGVITSERLYEARFQAEMGDVRRLLSKATFLGDDSKYHASRDLVAFDLADEEKEDDETLRATFAPHGRRLRDDYGPAGTAFFKACRVRMQAPVEVLAEWVLRAEGVKQTSALRYLLQGELGRSVSHELTGKLVGTWLESLAKLDNMSDFSNNELLMLRLQLGLEPELAEVGTEEAESLPDLISDKPKELLEYVYERWQEEKDELLEQHERVTYPEPLAISKDYDPTSLEHRRSWLTLLLLGALMTLGRTKSEQNKGFLRKCMDRGWMDVFVDSDPDRARWMSILESYFEDAPENTNEGEYRHWMSQFVTIYQLSRWLDDYVELILGLERARTPEDVAGVWAPRTAAALSGSGIDAPAIDKVLRLGRHFVIRELVRRGVLTNPLLYKYCFTPSRRIRHVFACIGCSLNGVDIHNSKTIYEFVEHHLGAERATYDLAFDLPFWSELYV